MPSTSAKQTLSNAHAFLVISAHSHAVQPFNHRTVVLNNLLLYYMRQEHLPQASSITQCLEGKDEDQKEEKGESSTRTRSAVVNCHFLSWFSLSSLETLTFSKSSRAEGRSAASEGSPLCFSILSPLTTVVLTTLLTFRPCTGSTSKSDAVAAPRASGSEKVSCRENSKMSRNCQRLLWSGGTGTKSNCCLLKFPKLYFQVSV